MQHGDECWCGMTYGRYQDRDETKCTSTCQSPQETMCGGWWRASVYRRHFDYNNEPNHWQGGTYLIITLTILIGPIN